MKKSDLYAHGNPYGYRYNVNHPWVHPIYLEYCRGIGAPSCWGSCWRFWLATIGKPLWTHPGVSQ